MHVKIESRVINVVVVSFSSDLPSFSSGKRIPYLEMGELMEVIM